MTKPKKNQPVIKSLDTLRVWVIPDGKYLFAQGLEVDYFTEGKGLKDTVESFLTGFSETLAENIKAHGHIRRYLSGGDPTVWHHYLKSLYASGVRELHRATFTIPAYEKRKAQTIVVVFYAPVKSKDSLK